MENLSGRTLFVAAVDAEAAHVPEGEPLLITGIGTVPAAIELTNALASAETLPERVINIGTAGALRDDFAGVFEVSHVRKHDFHLDVLSDISRYLLPEVIELETPRQIPRQHPSPQSLRRKAQRARIQLPQRKPLNPPRRNTNSSRIPSTPRTKNVAKWLTLSGTRLITQ